VGLIDTVKTLTYLPALLKLKKGMTPRPAEVKDSFGARVEANAENHPNASAIVFEGQQMTWFEFNALANRFANYMHEQGVKRGDVVSIMMENRIEYLAILVGLNKLGAVSGLLNSNLGGNSLIHCINVTGSSKCIVGEECMTELDAIQDQLSLQAGSDFFFVNDSGSRPCPNWAQDLMASTAEASESNPAQTNETTIGETALYIYTSGTTGLPKAAVLSNRRYLIAADMSALAGLQCSVTDRIYLCLPLYHATGLLLGAGAAFASGASMFVRRKFSASNFLNEIREHNCSHMIYIGELCRYLTNIPEQAGDAQSPLHSIMGNGMRPDIWMNFKKRYGIKRVCEFYGASEGNVSFANLMNKDMTVGMTSAEVELVKYDVDNDEVVTDDAGRCIAVQPGEAGLLLGKITPDTVFEGYTDPEATENKVFRNAFSDGDAWFNTGDLMRTVDVGYTLGYDHYQFVDRVGDTFRWKAENVSTNEVGEIINGFDQIKFCNVYGVEIPGTDGRAGMTALTLQDGVDALDLDRFAEFAQDNLPSYAVPVFLRIQPDIDVTGTFKMLKGDLRKQGYDINMTDDPIFVMKSGESTYTPMDNDYLALIRDSGAGY
jgi:citronellyl-CoA synthetase